MSYFPFSAVPMQMSTFQFSFNVENSITSLVPIWISYFHSFSLIILYHFPNLLKTRTLSNVKIVRGKSEITFLKQKSLVYFFVPKRLVQSQLGHFFWDWGSTT